MKVMVIVKASPESEAGQMPTEAMLREMGVFNDELIKAGVMLAGEGLHPSRRGKRIRFEGDQRTVIDGPFAETKELIGGYWIWQVRSVDEAVAWLRRAPFRSGEVVEIRPIFGIDDFGDELTPELRAQEERQREEMAAQAKN
ncbi:MAG: YciI family protein [Nannocystaceae bacterium]